MLQSKRGSDFSHFTGKLGIFVLNPFQSNARNCLCPTSTNSLYKSCSKSLFLQYDGLKLIKVLVVINTQNVTSF